MVFMVLLPLASMAFKGPIMGYNGTDVLVGFNNTWKPLGEFNVSEQGDFQIEGRIFNVKDLLSEVEVQSEFFVHVVIVIGIVILAVFIACIAFCCHMRLGEVKRMTINL